ncbi:T9SS type A sorting domain-containing protein, partial [bacterium]|nr:T9SS type A sorting domain-containing protein [bacterium]
VLSLGLSAKIWVNAIRDPGAELGIGDWSTEIEEYKEGGADSARVSVHDSTRAYEGKYSFLTDTKKTPYVMDAGVNIFCKQVLYVPKAVKDIDTCFWVVNFFDKAKYTHSFYILSRSQEGRYLRWEFGASMPMNNDTFFTITVPFPDSGVWTPYSVDFYHAWTNNPPGWPQQDTVEEVQLAAWGSSDVNTWFGQEVSWDNIVLRSVAYYDYASESIDSDELTGPSYTPIVTFANEGIKADKDAYVYAEILSGSTSVYVDSLKVSIPKESSKQVTFKPWSVTGGGPFTLRAYPMLELDELSTDDTVTKSISGINEPVTPATPVTPFQFEVSLNTQDVAFSFAPDIGGELSIFDACGREVFRSAINLNTGELHWSTRDMPSGLYFARFVSGKNIISNKFLIIR